MGDLLAQFRSAMANRYVIEEEAGRGGMATVYRARDLRHQRPVAIKVLHPEFAARMGRDRFLHEIKVVARLQHPYIVPLYDSGDEAEFLYFVMPLIEGESLRQLLLREGRLPIARALGIARGVAGALDYAHRHQVVHRDVKPENIMLHEGEALVMDFGIAKAISEATSGGLTQTGTSIGTPHYMSPEQANGEAELDGRSDIYSLGAVLYEMIAGAPPLTGANTRAILARLFTTPAPRLQEHDVDAPEWLEQALQTALAKSPDDRFRTASHFAQSLVPPGESLPSGAPAASGAPKSIAVLPFVNMSADPDNEYFTDGVAEEIINALTRIQALRVASRTSSFAFKGRNEDIGDIGRKLKVTTVLEGSVRKSGNRLRVTAQLINVSDGYHLWSERYDRELEDVFAIQDEIAGNIVRALRVVWSAEEKRSSDKPPTGSIQAYEYYLRGRQFAHQLRSTSLQYARRMFERAVELDPRYAQAYAAIADTCAYLYMYSDGSKANLDGAESASRKALELGPELAEAHASRGFALGLSKEYGEARREFETALRLNPVLFEAHYLYARECIQEGRYEEAVRHFADATRVRPEDYQSYFLATNPLRALGRIDEAVEILRRGLHVANAHLELNPDDARALYLGAGALMQIGEKEQALQWARRAEKIDSEDSGVLFNLACVYALGDMTPEALDCLERAIERGFGHREWIEHESDLDSLRSEPRFLELMLRM